MSKTVMGIGDPFQDYDPFTGLDGIGDASELSWTDLLIPGALVGKVAASEVQQAENTLQNFPSRPPSGGGGSLSKTKRTPVASASSSHWPWIAAAVGAAALGFVVVRRMRRKKRGGGKRHRRGRK